MTIAKIVQEPWLLGSKRFQPHIQLVSYIAHDVPEVHARLITLPVQSSTQNKRVNHLGGVNVDRRGIDRHTQPMTTYLPFIQLGVQVVVSVIGASLAAFLAARFTMDRFYREKTWERKAEAYTAIFESLDDMRQWYSVHYDAMLVASTVPEHRNSEMEASYKAAITVLRKRVAGETWLLEPDVEAIIQKCQKELEWEADSWQDHLDHGLFTVENTIAELKPFARSELNSHRKRMTWPRKRK